MLSVDWVLIRCLKGSLQLIEGGKRGRGGWGEEEPPHMATSGYIMQHAQMLTSAPPNLYDLFCFQNHCKRLPRTNIFKSILPLRVGSNPFPNYKGVKAIYSHWSTSQWWPTTESRLYPNDKQIFWNTKYPSCLHSIFKTFKRLRFFFLKTGSLGLELRA